MTQGSNMIIIHQKPFTMKKKRHLLFVLLFSTAHIAPAQNVGIGTTTPGDKLEVKGNIRLNGVDTINIYAAPSSTGNGKSIQILAGDPYVPVGGSGGSINI
jgi:hypothetical protein